MKYRKKIRSADLICMFLRESGVISESMTKLYAFRHDVIKIQRYVRSWFDAQQYRVRVRDILRNIDIFTLTIVSVYFSCYGWQERKWPKRLPKKNVLIN